MSMRIRRSIIIAALAITSAAGAVAGGGIYHAAGPGQQHASHVVAGSDGIPYHG